MGLFRDIGRRAERVKQRIEAAADATHECADCGTARSEDIDECPVCGSEDVVTTD